MKFYDISQEVFHCNVYPGDEVPSCQHPLQIENGDYLLYAAPINLGAADGAPCRAVLLPLM